MYTVISSRVQVIVLFHPRLTADPVRGHMQSSLSFSQLSLYLKFLSLHPNTRIYYLRLSSHFHIVAVSVQCHEPHSLSVIDNIYKRFVVHLQTSYIDNNCFIFIEELHLYNYRYHTINIKDTKTSQVQE